MALGSEGDEILKTLFSWKQLGASERECTPRATSSISKSWGRKESENYNHSKASLLTN